MTRLLYLLSAIVLVNAGSALAAKPAQRLNILLFTADDLHAESLGVYGGKPNDVTPHLDRFAAESMRFQRAHVNVAICFPSRSVMSTGLYSHRSGSLGFMQTHDHIPNAIKTFQQAGYLSGILGKVPHSTSSRSTKWDYAFQRAQLGNGRNPKIYHERAKTFFERCRKEQKPFYFMVNSHDPHRPYCNPNRLLKGAARPSKIYRPEDVVVPGFLPDLPGVRRELAHYLNSTRRLDDTFGEVMRALRESGYADNTLVIFISDNGIAVPFAKCNAWFHSSRTPWLVRWPGVVKPGSVNAEHFVSGVDLFPTFLDATGVKGPADLDGRSIVPLLKGETQSNRDFVFTQIDQKAGGDAVPMRCVQNAKFGYIYNPFSDGKHRYRNNNEGLCMRAMNEAAKTSPAIAARVALFRYRVPEEFYDLENDPNCLHNLIKNPKYQTELKSFRARMQAWMKLTKDPMLDAFLHRDDREHVDRVLAARPAWTTSKIKGAPYPPAPFAIRPAYPNLKFEKPTSLEEIPGGRILVSEIGGALYTFPRKNRQTRKKDLLLKISGMPKVWHATVHPKFASNKQLFVCYSKGETTYVSRYRVAGTPPRAEPGSEEVLLTWPAGGHNAGCLRFGIDGMLYISTGDGSGPNPPDGRTAAQDVSNLFGCILRIDVDRKASGKKYAVPDDNPFVNRKSARPEIWAYGLRNPWKFGIDQKTGNIFAADNGWESWEMVHRIVRGGNCGWPIMEGRAILRSEVKQGPTPIRPPVKDHSHTEANSVIGGPIYRGSKLKSLQGVFIYGDYITGTIWGLKHEGGDAYTHQTLVDTDQRITAFAEGAAGELFVLDFDFTGQIYELVPSGLKDRSADFPRRLSETGLFTSLTTMTPAPGVVPYDVVVSRWLDGAKTRRWVAIPGQGSISLSGGPKSAKYPEGTVFVKHVTLAGPGPNSRDVPIETQLLHYENGTWHPYTYAWNDRSGKTTADAVLVDAIGDDAQIALGTDAKKKPVTANWHFNAENECRMCHNAGSGFVLGFVPNQLDLPATRNAGGNRAPQLERLAAEQTITALPAFPETHPGRLVDPHDSKQSLDDRARSYLHGNCSACHHPGGNAIVSFYLRREMPFEKLNTNKGTGIGTFGLKNAKLIVPGDPYRSILLYRMSKLGYGRMPYIGSRVVDSRGVALIEKWIREMPHTDDKADSSLVRPGSRDARMLAELKQHYKKFQRTDTKATNALLHSTAGGLAVALGMHSGTIGRDHVKQVYDSKPGDIAGLFETFIPVKLRRKRLGRSIDPKTILTLKGDRDRGRLIFFSDGARCKNCHHDSDAGKSTGPTLVEIRKKYKRPAELLQHILKPSLRVDDKFATWVVATDTGKTITGLLISKSETEVVLKTAERKLVRIPKSQIDAMKKSRRSLMPEGILADLTAQQAADLLRWFGSL
eukprot:g33090.t1